MREKIPKKTPEEVTCLLTNPGTLRISEHYNRYFLITHYCLIWVAKFCLEIFIVDVCAFRQFKTPHINLFTPFYTC